MLQAAAGSPQLEAVRHELRELADKPDRLHRAARLLVPDTSPPRRLFLLVDQFEEVFTTCEKEDLRRPFIAALLHAARERGGPVVVALTMRADFSTKVAAYEELARVFDQHQFLVGPMSEAELRLAIEEPALRAGAEFEPGLVDTLLEDVHRQPGALRAAATRAARTLEPARRRPPPHPRRLRGHRQTGRRARTPRQRSLPPVQRRRPGTLPPRLPAAGASRRRRRGHPAPRRTPRVARAGRRHADSETHCHARRAGRPAGGHRGRRARQQGGFVEVAHETLIRSWSQLRKWLDADRAGLRTQRRLTEAAREWEEGGRKPDFLYTGGRLAVAGEWAARTTDELTRWKQSFSKPATASNRMPRPRPCGRSGSAPTNASAQQRNQTPIQNRRSPGLGRPCLCSRRLACPRRIHRTAR